MNNEIKKLTPNQFPSLLKEIADPPKELYIRGEFPDEEENVFLAVVGSRKYTSYGKDVCERLIFGLRGYPVVIVSGLALGIDSIAHRAALETGLKTIAIPGSGLDESVLYPRTHLNLAKKILENGGALISEFEPKERARPEYFPRRNRIMAGLSKGVLLIEAEERSGTLITARLASEYNRDVYIVPGSIFSPNSKGTNMLMRLGATPITSSHELLDSLGFDINQSPNKDQDKQLDLSDEENEILELLREPTTRDELIRQLGKTVSEINSLLSVMEIKGLIKEEMGEIRKNF